MTKSNKMNLPYCPSPIYFLWVSIYVSGNTILNFINQITKIFKENASPVKFTWRLSNSHCFLNFLYILSRHKIWIRLSSLRIIKVSKIKRCLSNLSDPVLKQEYQGFLQHEKSFCCSYQLTKTSKFMAKHEIQSG